MARYQEDYPLGTSVRIVGSNKLQDFYDTWKLHNRLIPDQLQYAGLTSKVAKIAFYHGGDVLYELENIPGIWHEQCLLPVN